MGRGLRWIAWAGLVLALGCGDGSPAPAAEVAARDVAVDVEVLVSGCRAPNEAPCNRLLEAPRDTVVAWVDVPPSDELVVRVDHVPVLATWTLLDGGTQLTFELEAGAEHLLIADGAGPLLEREVRWEVLPVEVLVAKLWLRWRVPGSLGRGLLRLADAFRVGEAKLRTRRFLQKLQFSGHRLRESRATLEALLPLAESLGARQDVAEIAATLAYQSLRARDFSGARRALLVLNSARDVSPEVRLDAHLREAEFATGVFDYAGALDGYRKALRLARRLGERAEAQIVENQYIILLSELGLREEASDLIASGLEALHTHEFPCHDKALLLGNFGWARLRLAALGLRDDIPRAEFEQALRAFKDRCPNAAEAANQIANLALAALLDGDIDESQAWVRELETRDIAPWLRPFVEELTREVRLHDPSWSGGGPLIAEPKTALGVGWGRWNQHGRELRNWGLDAAALEAFARAEEELDIATTTLPLALGQASYVGSRTSSLEALLALLLAADRTEDALCAVRKARRRSMSQVDRLGRVAGLSSAEREQWVAETTAFSQEQGALESAGREAWRGSVEEQRATRERLALREESNRARIQLAMVTTLGTPPGVDCADPIPEGVASLFAVPMGEAVALFVRDTQGVEAAVVPHPDSMTLDAWGTAALAPWEERISEASVLRISAAGDLEALAWARIPVGGTPLVEAVPIEFALDLPAGSAGPLPQRALVVADPSQNLLHARDEGTAALGALRAAKLDVRHLEGAEATRGATRQNVQGVELLYFAGHAEYDERTPWGSSMKLSDGSMGMAELFALSAMPSVAFLMGCETGATAANTRSGGINLGRGFLLAGTEQVLVSRIPVDDALAGRTGLKTVEHYLELGSLAAALRATQLELHAEDPEVPWWEFRVESR